MMAPFKTRPAGLLLLEGVGINARKSGIPSVETQTQVIRDETTTKVYGLDHTLRLVSISVP